MHDYLIYMLSETEIEKAAPDWRGYRLFIRLSDREWLLAHNNDATVAVVLGEWLHGVTEGLYGHAAG